PTGGRGESIDSSAVRCTRLSGTRLMGAPRPNRRDCPSVKRCAVVGDSDGSLTEGDNVSGVEFGRDRLNVGETGMGAVSGGRLTRRCATGSGATTGSSRGATAGPFAGRGEGRVSTDAASSPRSEERRVGKER